MQPSVSNVKEAGRKTAGMNDNKRFTPWMVALLVVILDQGSKWIIRSQMELHQSIPVLGDLLRITYIQNDGLAFGVDTPFGRWLGVLSWWRPWSWLSSCSE